MRIDFNTGTRAQLSTTVVAVYAFEGNKGLSGSAELLPAEARALVEELQASGELTGKSYEAILLHRPPGLAATKLLIIGAGKKDTFDSARLRRLAGAAVRQVRSRNIHELAWMLDAQIDPAAVQAVAEGAILADYDADRYRTERNSERRVDQLQLAAGGAVPGDEAQRALARGGIIAEAQNFSRDLVNEPPNFLTPTVLAERLQVMDATAIDLARGSSIPIYIFSLMEPGNIRRALLGEDIGSIVSD